MVLAAAVLGAAALPSVAQPAFTADQLEAILKPSPVAAVAKTRSLTPGEGSAAAPPAGEPGSGRLPDLRLLFKFNSAQLLPEATQQLDQLADAIGRDTMTVFRFQVAGHTDASGGEGYNLRLSQERAESAVAYLVDQRGVDPARLQAEGFGEQQLADAAHPTSPKNRRVEVVTVR
jgi:outer membrane protein OmpA-like peptidoglycan-associated protein